MVQQHSMATRESEKALRYIAQLDEARCYGNWGQVPELARKIEKHAPHRRCLVLTARSEAQVATYKPTERPSTAASDIPRPLDKLITPLLNVIEQETLHAADIFQATVCLAWIHWVMQEPGLAVARLPSSVSQELAEALETGSQSNGWIKVCGIKAGYIKGFAQEKTGHFDDGLDTYNTFQPFLVAQTPLGRLGPEFCLWTERMICRIISIVTSGYFPGERLSIEKTLLTFHLWLSLSNAKRSSPPQEKQSGFGVIHELGREVEFSRWDIWMSYYRTVSYILQEGMIYAPSYTENNPRVLNSRLGLSDQEFLKVRLLQRTEMKNVERYIEAKLLQETQFPKSNQRKERVERWVEAIIANWKVMCGPTWQDDELGAGGKNAITHGVLDVLYRAATKTFHSTQILRHLFTVHAYVAEFELAFKAFDSYVEIIQRGRDRVKKSGTADSSLDGDETVLKTAVEAIKILCRFGERKDAEKAKTICVRVSQWLQEHVSQMPEDSSSPFVVYSIPPQTVSVTYYALGLCESVWSRLTFEPAERSLHQNKAIEHLREALAGRWGNTADLEILFALAMVLGETRDIPGAIKVVKRALAQPMTRPDMSPTYLHALVNDDPEETKAITFTRERRLIPFWHLLALLLTSKADVPAAIQSCDAAFEQFQDPENLFGPAKEYRSDHLNEKEKDRPRPRKALVDLMDRTEKDSVMQVKITQLALIEESEGPVAAVDSCTDLLALYSRLFGDSQSEKAKILGKSDKLAVPTTSHRPKSAVGTLRNSIFGRSRSRSRGRPDTAAKDRPTTKGTIATTAPTIQVTNEDEDLEKKRSIAESVPDGSEQSLDGRSRASKEASRPNMPRRQSSRLRKRRSGSMRRSEDSMRPQSTSSARDPIPPSDVGSELADDRRSVASSRPRSAKTSSVAGTERRESFDHSTRKMPFHLPLRQGALSSQDNTSSRQGSRVMATPVNASMESSPQPRLPTLQLLRHKTSLLVEVWLFISGLYTRATMFEDALGACNEASSLVQHLETEIGTDTSSAKHFASKGWGIGKDIESLWADVWAQRGDLSSAKDEPIEAQTYYEKALAHSSDHPTSIIGLATILLDIYTCKIPHEAPESTSLLPLTPPGSSHGSPTIAALTNGTSTTHKDDKDSPESLNRLAARDRAYMLLSTVTKSGAAWDSSEAWFALARAYEESGQPGKAKEVLWWCVELEDTRPVRRWDCVVGGGGAYVLL